MTDFVISGDELDALDNMDQNDFIIDVLERIHSRKLSDELKKERERCIKILVGKFLQEVYPRGIPKFVDTEHDTHIPSIGIDVLSEMIKSLRSEP